MGDVEPPFDASRGAAAARARPADLRVAARRDRVPGDDRPAAIACSIRARNASAIAAAVLSGLAVSVFPESGLAARHARALGRPMAFPNCRRCRIGLVRNPHERLALADALAEHIISSLDNLSEAAQAAE